MDAPAGDANDGQRALDPNTYWQRGPELELSTFYWNDPEPDLQGMLSSDLIEFYNEAVGPHGMINPFNRENLKAAAYELTLGPNCMIDGKVKILSRDDPWLTTPPNSIVFVSMAERLCMPHYIAGRFDLAIEFIYQGILLGTGPQVDPGFQGVLSTPLHNISNASVNIRLGYPFAKIDFTKTSGLRYANLTEIATEPDLYAAQLAGYHNHSVKLFNVANRWRQPIYAPDYAGQKAVASSLAPLEDKLDSGLKQIYGFEEEISRIRRFGLGGALATILAVVAILVTLAQLDRTYTDSKVDAVENGDPELARTVRELRSDVADVMERIQMVEERPPQEQSGGTTTGP